MGLASPSGRTLDILRLVSDAAHELVGPVNQLSSLVALLVNRYRGQLDEEAASLLSHIESAGARTASVASGLRTYLRMITAECEPQRVDTSAVVESALLELKREIDDAQAVINCGPLPDVQGNADLLSQLFQIVIRNSLQFRRPETTLCIAISSQCSSARCLFSIADNGIGIDPAYHEAVFHAFTRLTGHSSPGAGMGLTIARAIVDVLGGRIWIAPTTPPGLSVYIDLPEAH